MNKFAIFFLFLILSSFSALQVHAEVNVPIRADEMEASESWVGGSYFIYWSDPAPKFKRIMINAFYRGCSNFGACSRSALGLATNVCKQLGGSAGANDQTSRDKWALSPDGHQEINGFAIVICNR